MSLEYRQKLAAWWFDTNNLQLNASKTREMMVDCRIRKHPLAPIIVNGDSTERVDCFKFLGMIISSDLAWENNTDAVVKTGTTKTVQFSRSAFESILIFSIMCMVRRHQSAPEEQA